MKQITYVLHKTENSSTYSNCVIKPTNSNVKCREKSCMVLERRSIAQDQNAWTVLWLKWLCCSLHERIRLRFWWLVRSTPPISKQRWKWVHYQPFLGALMNYNPPTLIQATESTLTIKWSYSITSKKLNQQTVFSKCMSRQINEVLKGKTSNNTKKRRSIALRLGPNLRAIAPLRTQTWTQSCLPFINKS